MTGSDETAGTADSKALMVEDGAAVDRGYVLGHSSGELERLGVQARMLAPITRRLLIEAGVGRGMRVLDVGSGTGDVACRGLCA